MPYDKLDRSAVKMTPLCERENKKEVERDGVPADRAPGELPSASLEIIAEASERIRAARRNDRPVMVAFGAHTIKNGLAPVLIRLIEEGWVTHLATNGAGVIHDWEFAYQGKSCEHVELMVREGRLPLTAAADRTPSSATA